MQNSKAPDQNSITPASMLPHSTFSTLNQVDTPRFTIYIPNNIYAQKSGVPYNDKGQLPEPEQCDFGIRPQQSPASPSHAKNPCNEAHSVHFAMKHKPHDTPDTQTSIIP